jgi:hypothetical protein
MKCFIISAIAVFIWQFSSSQEAKLLDQKTFAELGTITSSTKQPIFFKFINDGELPLLLSEVRTSFGYEVVYFPEKVLPKAIDSIGVMISTEDLQGPFRKTVSIVSGTNNGISVFVITGRVED